MDNLNQDFKFWFESDGQIWQQSLSKESKSLHDHFQEICTVNQIILDRLKQTKQEIYQGKLNNKHHYFESDFIVVDVVLKIYSEFSNKKIALQSTEIHDLKQILLIQLEKLFQEIEHFPDDFATNVKSSPGIITTVKLDYYQLIYLSLTHAQHQLLNMKLKKEIWTSIRSKTPRQKQMAK